MTSLEYGARTSSQRFSIISLQKIIPSKKIKINQEEFEKMTELEQEWLLFRRAELNEQLEKWIDIKTKLDERKKSNDAITYKN